MQHKRTAGKGCGAFGIKFLILEVVDWVFGDHVELGKLLEVILLAVAMLATNALMQGIPRKLGLARLELAE